MVDKFYNKYLEECISYMQNADHLINHSFRTIQDPKIIMSSLNNMLNSFKHGFKWLGNWSYYSKNINFLPELDTDFIDLFSTKLIHQYSFDKYSLKTFNNVKKFIEAYDDSYMVFKKNDSIVICNNIKNSFKSFSIKEIDGLLKKNKAFVKDLIFIKEDTKDERISC